MRIGTFEVDDKDGAEIDGILSNFYGTKCRVTGGGSNIDGGAAINGMHYKLDIDNGRHASIKISRGFSTHGPELAVRDIRKLLKLESYRAELVAGFPMNGEMWREAKCLLVDWGKQNQRINLGVLDPHLPSEDREKFLKEVAINGALACSLGLWDRSIKNYVWDEASKRLISIDHEDFYDDVDIDTDIPQGISIIMVKFFGENWYIKELLASKFTGIFSEMWGTIEENKIIIQKIFQKYGHKPENLIPRIGKGPAAHLDLIMK